MRTYEVMTIHRPELADTDVETHVGEIRSFLKGKGATITATDMWGKRRLAYEIEHFSEGYYTVVTGGGDRPDRRSRPHVVAGRSGAAAQGRPARHLIPGLCRTGVIPLRNGW